MNTIKTERLEIKLWRLLEPFQSNLLPELIVPAGFIFDGLSAPELVRGMIDNGDYGSLESAVLHDWLYKQMGYVNKDLTLTRKQSDMIFLHELLEYKIPAWKSYTCYFFVRMLGEIYWGVEI